MAGDEGRRPRPNPPRRPAGWRAAVAAVLAAAACASPEPIRKSPPRTAGAAPPAPSTAAKPAPEKKPYAVLVTSSGTIVVRLFYESAPKAVQNFIGLATGSKAWTDPATGASGRGPLYNGTRFFRVIPDFMIQGGSPLNGPFGGPGYQFDDEFSSDHLFIKAGLVGMANAGPNTNGSQFFITLIPSPWLNYKHTVFGEVVEGLDAARAIAAAPRRSDAPDRPVNPVVLQEVRIEYR